MIIKALTIENFKGIREPVRVEFKPITLLFGPNSAGKSTIVQALHYARELLERQSADTDLTLQGGEFVDLGGFENLVHSHDRNLSVVLRFELDLTSEDLPEYHSGNRSGKIHSERERQLQAWNLSSRVTSAWVVLTVDWSNWRNQPFISQYEVGINGEQFGRISAAEDTRRVWISELNFAHPLFVANDEPQQERNEDEPPISQLELLCEIVTTVRQSDFNHSNSAGLELEQLSAVPKWGSTICIAENCLQDLLVHGDDSDVVYDEFTFYLNQLIVGPGELLREALQQFRYLGPIREIPPRNYQELRSHDPSRWANGLAAWDILYASDDSLIARVSDWMDSPLKEKLSLKTGYSVEMRRYKEITTSSLLYRLLISNELLDSEEDVSSAILQLPEKRRLVLYDRERDLDLLPQDIGIGISQVLPVVVSALAGNGALVAIEQPELHIHPRLQTELADVFIEAALGEQKNTFLIETHSEHLILRLMRRMRQTSDEELPDGSPKVTPEDVSILYVLPTNIGSVVRVLELDAEGQFLDPWPGGFFEEGYKERFA